jgi:desulfoferrodoxin-like iron-binding protein
MVAVNVVSEIYRCDLCGNAVEVIKVGGGELACYAEPVALEDEED